MAGITENKDPIHNEKTTGAEPSGDPSISSIIVPSSEQEKSHPDIPPEPSTAAPPEYSKVVPSDDIVPVPVSVPLDQLGEEPAPIDCPHCRATGVTTIRKVDPGPDQSVHNCALVVCCLVGPLFAWMPYAFRTKHYDTFHDCPNCKAPLAYREHTGATQVIPIPPPPGMRLPGQKGGVTRPAMAYEASSKK